MHVVRASLVVIVLSGSTLACGTSNSLELFVGPPVASPDEHFVARVTEDNCGATCGFNMRVALMDLVYDPDRPRPRTIVLDGNVHPCTVLLQWRDNRHLDIVLPVGADIEAPKREWEGVSIALLERDITDEEVVATYGDHADCYAYWFVQR